jgi:hypothetical protein
MAKNKCIVCEDARNIPPDAVPLASFGGRTNGRAGSWEYETLHRMCKAGEIRSWKFSRGKTGQIFVLPGDAEVCLAESRAGNVPGHRPPVTRGSSDQSETLAIATARHLVSAVTETNRLLERIAAAAELLATTPKPCVEPENEYA